MINSTLFSQIAFCLLIALCSAQDYDEYEQYQPQQQPANPRYSTQQKEKEQKSEPVVAILKQINRHNEDGSYTYGYEASDGSFKIETKTANGEVKGKYGYVDETGKVRMVEYGANKFGFQPSGEGITVSTLIPFSSIWISLSLTNPIYTSQFTQKIKSKGRSH